MMRSAGSEGGLPGRKAEAIRVRGDMGASLTPGSARKASNHESGAMLSMTRPFCTSVATSQAEIGETKTPTPIDASAIASRACSEMASPFATHSTAHVSRRRDTSQPPSFSVPELSGGLRQLDVDLHPDGPLQSSKGRTGAWCSRLFPAPLTGTHAVASTRLDLAEHKRFPFHANPLRPKPRSQPSSGHRAVSGITGPPGTVSASHRGQSVPDQPRDLTERRLPFVLGQESQMLCEGRVLGHGLLHPTGRRSYY